MKILIVRHGDPDYELDSLTPKGFREAEFLAQKLAQQDIKDFYVSPLGRAKATAACTLNKMNRNAKECMWLREFQANIYRPDAEGREIITWDWLPQDWMEEERFFQYDHWFEPDILQAGKVKEQYDWVVENLDQLLKEHGYMRSGHFYQAMNANNDTIVFFCHFGVECVLLSHLLNISPMVLWHHLCAAPSSVTTVVTEERRKGIAAFRMLSFGDTSHLYKNNELPAFAARFCEAYENAQERHD